MRVLFIVTDDWYFWSHRRALSEFLISAGCTVALASKDTGLFTQISKAGIRTFPVEFGRGLLGQRKNFGVVRRLKKIIEEWRPDIVHNVSFLPLFYGSRASEVVHRVRVVNAVTGLGAAFSTNGRSSILQRLLLYCYGIVGVKVRGGFIFQNSEDRKILSQAGALYGKPAVVIPGAGVDTDHFSVQVEPDNKPFTITFVGRMVWSKGPGDLVDASELLLTRGVEHRVLLVGDIHSDNPNSVDESTVKEWSSRPQIQWLGRMDDVRHALSESHVVALPSSYGEGVPLALIEAAACGKPLIAYDSRGCRDVVEDGRNGILVSPKDVVGLADAMEQLANKPELRMSYGLESRARAVSEYSIPIVGAQTLEFYRVLLADN